MGNEQNAKGAFSHGWQRWVHFFAAVLIGVMAWSGAAWAEDDLVARLDGKDIKASEMKAVIDGLDPSLKERMAKDPQVALQVVRAELGRRVVLDEARKRNWESRPDVAARIERAKKDVIVSSFLESVSAPPSDFPSEAEIQAAYDQNRDRFMMARQFHLLDIFVAAPDGNADAGKKAEELARKARARGANFADLARAGSDDRTSAAEGGDLGWIPQNRLQPEVLAAVKGMAENDVSDPLHVASGWHIFKLAGTKAAGPRPLVEVRDGLVSALRQQRIQQAQQSYIDQQLNNRNAAVNEIALRKMAGSGK